MTFDGGTPGSGTWILGAPEVVLTDRSGSADATPAAAAALGKAGRHAESGLRTVVLAPAADTTVMADGATLPAVV